MILLSRHPLQSCCLFLGLLCVLGCETSKSQSPSKRQALSSTKKASTQKQSHPIPKVRPKVSYVHANLQEIAAAKENRHLEIYHLVARKGLAFACTIVQGLQIYNIQDPRTPQDIGELRFPMPYGAYGKPGCRFVALDGNIAYLTDSINALQPLPFLVAVDISNPKAPVALAYFSNKKFDLQQVVAQNGWVYVASVRQGLLTFKLHQQDTPANPSSTSKPSSKDQQPPPKSKQGPQQPTCRPAVEQVRKKPSKHQDLQKMIALSSRLAQGTPRTTPGKHSLQLHHQLQGFQNAQGLTPWKQYLLVADGPGGLKVVDLKHPNQPRIISHVTTRGFARRVSVWNNHAYVAEGSMGFEVFSLHNPKQPRRVAAVPTPYSVMQIEISHDRAFVANWNDLRVYNIKNPSRPTLVAKRALKKRPDTFRMPHEKSLSRIRNATLALHYPHVILGEWQGLRTVRYRPHQTPILKLSSRRIVFSSSGKKNLQQVTVTNLGQVPLYLSRIQATSDTFSSKVASLWIPPKQSKKLFIRYQTKKRQPTKAKLTFATNDPHQREGSIALEVTSPVHYKPHTEFALKDLNGRTVRLSDLRGKVVLLSYFATF